MRRREFITLLGGTVAWPFAARAEQSDRVRRLGLLMLVAETDSLAQAERTAFTTELQRLGWIESGKIFGSISAGPMAT